MKSRYSSRRHAVAAWEFIGNFRNRRRSSGSEFIRLFFHTTARGRVPWDATGEALAKRDVERIGGR